MPDHTVWNEPLVEQTVTYHIEVDGRLSACRKRARQGQRRDRRALLCPGNGRTPATGCLWEQRPPVRTIQTPVYEYASLP